MTRFLELEAYLGGEFLHPGGDQTTRALLELLNVPKGGLVLELGCGTGATAALVARRRGVRVVALDQSSVMLTASQTLLQREQQGRCVHLVQTDVGQTLAFSDATFDAIYAESVVALLEAESVICECARVLRPSGQMVLNERVWKPGTSQALTDEINQLSRRMFGIPAATSQPLDKSSWLQLLDKAGLVKTHAIPIDTLLSPQRPSLHLRQRLRRAQKYLAWPRTLLHSLKFKVITRQYRTLWSHLECYLFLAQKPI